MKKSSVPIKKITVTAMMTALSVIIGIICKNLFTWGIYYRVTFENFPLILTGFCFGPVFGAVAALCADTISCLCSKNPAINPIITLGAVSVGLISGFVPKIAKKLSLKYDLSLALTVATAHLIGQVFIKTLGKIFMFGMPWYGLFIGLGISVFVGICEFYFIRLLLKNKEISGILGGITDYELH